jgi:hypothetical protein
MPPGSIYQMASAKNDEGIEEVFSQIAELIYRKNGKEPLR